MNNQNENWFSSFFSFRRLLLRCGNRTVVRVAQLVRQLEQDFHFVGNDFDSRLCHTNSYITTSPPNICWKKTAAMHSAGQPPSNVRPIRYWQHHRCFLSLSTILQNFKKEKKNRSITKRKFLSKKEENREVPFLLFPVDYYHLRKNLFSRNLQMRHVILLSAHQEDTLWNRVVFLNNTTAQH